MKNRIWLCVGLSCAIGTGVAQNAPQACYPGSLAPGCPPPNHPAWGRAPAPLPKQIYDVKRKKPHWAAVAHNPLTSSLGLGGQGDDVNDKQAAEEMALDACRNNGGGDGCKIVITYKNECATVAFGPDSIGKGMLFADRGRSEERATANVLKKCKKSGVSCHPVGSNCVSEGLYLDGWELR